MAVLFASCITAFLVCFVVLPVIIKYTVAKNLLDVPGRRKIHKKVTPSLGGIAIFVGFIISVAIWMGTGHWESVRFMLASLFIVFLIGVRDDLVPFRALHKLYGQIIAIAILLFSDVGIDSFYGLFGINEIPIWTSYLLTGISLIVITNAFNLIDGLDGLAGSIGLISLLAFGAWFFWVDDYIYAMFCFAMAGGILAFLVYNWQPAEIFMGDTGAMVIGMMLGVMAIRFMNVNQTLGAADPARFAAPIATAACFIIVPLADTLRIVILRLSKGQSPFKPDKSHIHHTVMRLGLTHARTAMILAAVNLLFIVGGFVFREVSEIVKLTGIVLLAAIMSFILDRLIIRKLSTKGT
jgi:UDP-GlcNAc:undecaprenyl-phosphate GlcNAc-1-phosphate transferase